MLFAGLISWIVWSMVRYQRQLEQGYAAPPASVPASRPAKPGTTTLPREPNYSAKLLPEVLTFIVRHKLGQPVSVESLSDWTQGKRQRVGFWSGRSLLFYTKDGQVVTVYEDLPGVGRKVVWGRTE